MTIQKIIYAGDARLRQKADPIKQFTPQLEQLAIDMLDTMRNCQGVGLAGPQIGVMQRIFVAEIPASRGEGQTPHPQSGTTYILVNPEIVTTSGNLVEGQEGCLSLPNWYGLVPRPGWVEVKAQDVTGREIKLKVDDLLARIFLHEIDHLNGILFIDHITDLHKLWQVIPEEKDEQLETEAIQEIA